MDREQQIEHNIQDIREVKDEILALKADVIKFDSITRSGLIKAAWQGMIMVVCGVILSVIILGYSSRSYSCGAQSFVSHQNGLRYDVCRVVFPQVDDQVKILVQQKTLIQRQIDADKQRTDVARDNQKKLDNINNVVNQFSERYLTTTTTTVSGP